MSTSYRFAPWARRGLARAHQNADVAGASQPLRPRVNVGLTLLARQDGNPAPTVGGQVNLMLYGPADVIGIDPRLIVRTDPKPNARNVEPNYLVVVDFDPPDFPWLLTPARADAAQRLRPWLVLVVVERAAVEPPTVKSGRPLPSILIAEAAVTQLPDLKDSALWAHVQAVSKAGDGPAVAAEMQQQPAHNVSRLVCPRRLKANTAYLACVVPATEGGRLRGLNMPVPGTDHGDAWKLDDVKVELPVYFHWEFSTGPVGDIEALARRLRTPMILRDQLRAAGDEDALKELADIGRQDVYVDADRLMFTGQPKVDKFEGAMVALGFEPKDEVEEAPARLESILNTSTEALAGSAGIATTPTLGPPMYGEHPARRHQVNVAGIRGNWLDELNLQPRYRLAAGWGAEVIRQHQDEFMQAAWEQVGDVLAAERALSLSRLSCDVLRRVEHRHLKKLSEERLLAVLGPAQARLRISPRHSLQGELATVTMPPELFDGAMRRQLSPRSRPLRLAQLRQHADPARAIPEQVQVMVQAFAQASTHIDRIDPNAYEIDGLSGSRSYEAIPLPDDPAQLVDLAPYIGLDVKLPAAQIRTLQANSEAARTYARSLPADAPQMQDLEQGLLTETHRIRIDQLERATGKPLTGDVLALIREASSVANAEGVLLGVREGGQLFGEALHMEVQSGELRTAGAVFALDQAGRIRREAQTSERVLATVTADSLGHLGTAGLLRRLGPSVLALEDAPVRIERARGAGGLFQVEGQRTTRRTGGAIERAEGGVTVQPQPAVATVTLPPLVRDAATLDRYKAAFQGYVEMVAPPAGTVVKVAPVDLKTQETVKAARVRLDPVQTIPRRLASMLSLGDEKVSWTDSVLVHPQAATRLDLAIAGGRHFVIPKTFDRVMHYPELRFPLSRKLQELAPETFLPGVGRLPDNFIMSVQTNPRFVEAFMLGANHEMARELLWNGYPTDSRGTPFQRFWQHLDSGTLDLSPIHTWNHQKRLGAQDLSKTLLVLLIRGQLFERFPNLSIYAYKKSQGEQQPGGASGSALVDSHIKWPVFRGHLFQDITYVGFDIQDPRTQIQEYFFIIEEHVTEPRFGFDEPDARIVRPDDQPSWMGIDWDELQVDQGVHITGAKLQDAASNFSVPNRAAWANPHSATVADALLQRPFRGFWPGEMLKPPEE